jgi:PIN domain nuclease of toxin-antitoxin system
MNLLLDTHSFIWFGDDNIKLSSDAKKSIENSRNNIFISIATLWEMAIKISIGKLETTLPLDKIIKQINNNGFEILPIFPEHTLIVSKLKFHHRDPFDRIIIAQGLSEKMTIVSNELIFDKYKVKRIW